MPISSGLLTRKAAFAYGFAAFNLIKFLVVSQLENWHQEALALNAKERKVRTPKA
jgi:hypothetical protein